MVMDVVGAAGLRFIHGGKGRNLDTILGSTKLVLCVCVSYRYMRICTVENLVNPCMSKFTVLL